MSRLLNFLGDIPTGTWLGMVVLVFMSTVSDFRPFLLPVALAVIIYTMWRDHARLSAFEQRQQLAKETEAKANISPDGPGLQDLLAAIPNPVLVISANDSHDIAGRWITYANEAAFDMFDMRETGGLLVNSVRNPEVLEIVDEALFGKISRSISFDLNGSQPQFWRAYATPLLHADAQYLFSCFDLT